MHSTTLWKCSIFYRGKNLPAAIVSPHYKENLSLRNNERASLVSWLTVSAAPRYISIAIHQCRTLQKWWGRSESAVRTFVNVSTQAPGPWFSVHLRFSLSHPVFNQQASDLQMCALTACRPNPRRCALGGINPVSGGYICRWRFWCCLFCGTVGGRCGTLPCFSFGPLSGAPDRWHDITGQACSTMQRSCGPLI